MGCIILQTATDNNPRQINTEHEYILCYAKDIKVQSPWYATNEKAQLIQDKYFELKKKYGTDIDTIQARLRTWIKKSGDVLKGVAHYDNVDEKGVFHDGDIANTTFGGYKYEVIHPVTHKVCKIPEKGFRFPEATMKKMIADGDIMFGTDETTLIKPKKRLENAKDVLRSVIYEDGRASTKKFENIMSRDIFQNTKSPMILGRLMNFVINDRDIVLDFFSGSGTTAEAILHNNFKCTNNVRFIMVQLPENLDESKKKANSRAKKTINNAINFLDSIGLNHTICDIGEERIRRAGKKIKEETGADIDYGFRCFKVDSTNMKEVYYCPADIGQMTIDQFTDNIKEDRTPEDLLFQVMLDLGVLLSSKIEEQEIAGKRVFSVADGYLLACFDAEVTEDVVTQIAKQHPFYAVFRDNSMADDSVAANFEQIFATYSPETVRKVL